MSNSKVAPNWERFKKLDIGELNQLNSDVFRARYDKDQSLDTTLASVFQEHYGYDIVDSTAGPFAAVVLEVLNGPQIKNQATTGGRVNTATINIDSYPFPFWQDSKQGGSKNPVVVKAKIPEFDADIEWPEDAGDKARIDAHGEYYQWAENEDLEKVGVGDIVWISFDNTYCGPSLNGRPAGKLLGVYKKAAKEKFKTFTSPRSSIDPKCKKERLSGMPGGLYVGGTDPNPNELLRPSIRKIKSKIKTGVYGNGTPQTKAHFVQCLDRSLSSPQNKIPGPAPGPKNSFLWVGSLRDNGYMDILDRPGGIGRETIIYAPMNLDLGAAVEIIYYMHDEAGFGHSHISGPNATISDAIDNAVLPGNDFREKIAPAIKDLNRQGRNYILVVPELSFSRGYGTGVKDKNRVQKLTEGSSATEGQFAGPTLRSRMDAATRSAVKNYLKYVRIENSKSALHVTPLREREFANFDGTFTGGVFGNFHQQVLEVLDEHIGQINDEVIHFVADGLGAITLCAVVADFSASAVHSEARSSFFNAFPGRRLRFDFLLDSEKEGYYENAYGYLFGVFQQTNGGQITTEINSPSLCFYHNFLTLMASEPGFGHVEFNYISTPSGATTTNKLFSFLGKEKDYKNAVKAAPAGKLGEKKLAYKISEIFPNSANPEVYVSFHMSPEDTQQIKNSVSYSLTNVFTMPSGHTINHPKKPDASSSLQPSFSEVPNHSYALATSPSRGDLDKITVRQKELLASLKFFENLIKEIQSYFTPGDDIEIEDELCDNENYKIFCEDSEFKIHKSSKFHPSYLNYLKEKKEYMELTVLAQHELRILDNINDRDQLIIHRNEIQKENLANDAALSKTNPDGANWHDVWNSFHVGVKSLLETYAGVKAESPNIKMLEPEKPNEGFIASTADLVCRKEAYKKIQNKINSAIDNINPENIPTNRPAECQPQPTTIAAATAPGSPTIPGIPATSNNCASIGNFDTPSQPYELTTPAGLGIHWALANKKDFDFGSDRVSTTKTTIHKAIGFEAKPFEYTARSTNGNTTSIKNGPALWACLGNKLTNAINLASSRSNYFPIRVVKGITGFDGKKLKTKGVTAYESGLSLHAFGLAFDLDPGITGYSVDGSSINSVFTGAWGYPYEDKSKREELHKLGVYSIPPEKIYENIYEADNRRRLVENWSNAPSAYKKNIEKYNKFMMSAKGAPIVMPNANPVIWVIEFCLKSGMKWGNGTFLKKRHRNGKDWNQSERKRLSIIFGYAGDVVEAVRSISWNSEIDDHMHFQYWNGQKHLIEWKKDGTI